jgi:Secretion system C-terminal sorting domain
MKKFISIFVLLAVCCHSIFAQIVPPFLPTTGYRNNCNGFTWYGQGSVPYLDGATIDVCANDIFYFKPICIAFHAFIGMEIETSGVGTITAIDSTLSPYPYSVTFTQPGIYKVKAYHSFNGGTPFSERCIYFRVSDVAGASGFNLNSSILCPQPNNSITLTRVQPSNVLYAYQIKLYEVNPNTTALTQVWASGYVVGDFSTYTIGTAQYPGFTGGKNYRVELLAVPEKKGTCKVGRSTQTKDFKIWNTSITPNFTLLNAPLDLVTPKQIYQCDASTTFGLQNTTISYAPVEYRMDVYQYDYDNTGARTLVYASPTWTSTAPTQLPTTLLPVNNYIIKWSVRSTCPPNTVVFKEGWFYLNGLPTTAGALNYKFRKPNGYGTGLYARNQTTPTVASPIGTPLLGGTSVEVRSYPTLSSGLVNIKPTIEIVNCNTGGPVSPGAGLTSTILCNSSFTQPENIYTSAQLNTGVPLNNLYIDADGLNYGSTTVSPGYFTNLAITEFGTVALPGPIVLSNKCFKLTLEGQSAYCGANIAPITQWSYFRFLGRSSAIGNYCPICRTFDADGDIATQNLGIDANSLQLYPNPANTQINIGFVAQQEGKARIILTDLTGRTVKEFFQTILEGDNTVSQSIADLPNALYIYTVQAGSQNLSGKFIKQD